MSKSIKDVRLDVELEDGREFKALQIRNHALAQWDLTRTAKGWPSHEDARFLWMTFLAWQTLVDRGDYEHLVDNPRNPKGARVPSFERFRDTDCLYIVDVTAAEDPEGADVDPTQATAESDSASTSPQPPASAPPGFTPAVTAS